MIPVTLALSVNPQSTNKTEDPFVRPRKRGPANKKATLVDVAERANVSAITVSRVINQPDKVSEELRLRVQQAIDELGYIPTQSARSLATARSGELGVTFPTHSHAVYILFMRA